MDVSIIIPAYNAAAHLGRAIESVLVQEGVFFEVIIVDNNSTDETLSIAKEYQSEHPDLITVFSEIEQGAGAARNKGLSMAKGTFVQFLDADDVLLPGKLSRQIVLCEQVAWVIGVSRRNDEVGAQFDVFPLPDAWKGLVVGRIGDMNANFFRRNALLRIKGQNNKLQRGEDTDMYFRLLQLELPYTIDGLPGSVYFQMPENRLSIEPHEWFLARIIDRNLMIIEFLQKNKPQYWQEHSAYFISAALVEIRRLLTEDWFLGVDKFGQLSGKHNLRIRDFDLTLLPSFALLYPLLGFLTVERLRLKTGRFFPRRLKTKLKGSLK